MLAPPSTITSNLMKARTLYEESELPCQGPIGDRFCALEALGMALGISPLLYHTANNTPEGYALLHASWQLFSPGGIVEVNDNRGKEAALQVFDRAIENTLTVKE